MRIIITIDTEGDNQWDHGRDLTVENITYIPRFQNLCEKFNIKPTYLVTTEVAQDKVAREIFTAYSKTEKAEIGAHLHSWSTPPFIDQEGYRENDVNHAFASELPYDLLENKIRTLTNQIETSFGKRPTSFRSGRYGFNESVAKSLIKNGYLVDSSVTPFVTWAAHKGVPDRNGGPDFIDRIPYPYQMKFENDAITEIPITILPTRFPFNRNFRMARSYFRNVNNNLFLRGLRKLFYTDQPIWLRPTPNMTMQLFEKLIYEAIIIKLPFIVMMFHSSELMPGCSKYRPDRDSVEKLYELLEQFFVRLEVHKIPSVTLTEASKSWIS